jgi:fatty acid synthase
VCGAGLLIPESSMSLVKLGAVSLNGFCRPFDNEAGGYVRSEAIVALYLQKARDAKRIYATILHSKTNCDGYKEEGNFSPSSKMQAELMMKFYREIEIAPNKVNYVEAHGTGTKVGDLAECTALDKNFCFERDTPLFIGSVKSNMGHSKAASATCGIIKAVLALETGKIAPNLNFTKPREDIEALQSGRLQVVTETQELEGSLIAVNSFGIGGTNGEIENY